LTTLVVGVERSSCSKRPQFRSVQSLRCGGALKEAELTIRLRRLCQNKRFS